MDLDDAVASPDFYCEQVPSGVACLGPFGRYAAGVASELPVLKSQTAPLFLQIQGLRH
jgi:hypothetical protein